MRVKKFYIRLKRNWQRLDRRYGWRWRTANLFAALLVLFAMSLPLLQHVIQDRRYQLSDAALKLVGDTDQKLTKQLTYDAQNGVYQFNKDAIQAKDADNPLTALKQQTGAGDGSKSNKSLYALDVPQDASKGVTYHDINSQLDFTLKPQFKLADGQTVDGHLVYPMADDAQAVYTLKNNGLKEDIVVAKASDDTMSFSYNLDLPKTLEARMLPDGSGGIGIYSANPSLFSNISYGSDADRSLVEKARENGEKNFLVFGLPAPVIKTVEGGDIHNAVARFELDGSTLSVVATHLSDITTPFTIDPSVVVTSTSDFANDSNNEGMIDFGTADQIQRSKLTGGGTTNNWVTNTDTGATRPAVYAGGATAYNGFIYTYSRDSATVSGHMYYAPLNSNGSLGAWVQAASDPATVRVYPGMVIYNGYIYIYGGSQASSNTVLNTVTYAPINSDGSVGSWSISSNTMQYGVCRLGFAAANGYLYATGGNTVATSNLCANSSTPSNYVQYAPLNGDGSVGAWATTTAFTTARMDPGTVTYNNFIYVYMGTVDGTTGASNFQYAPLNSDGTVGAWVIASVTSPGQFYRFGIAVNNGYIYMIGGGGGNTSTTVRYIQLGANGAPIGSTWTTSAGVMATATWGSSAAIYNGYIYAYAGVNSVGGAMTSIQYGKIDQAGTTRTPTTTGNTALPAGRAFAPTVIYNGFIYLLGGNNTTGVNNGVGIAYNDTIYAPINADGTVGTWSTASTFNGAARRNAGAAAAYGGYMYYIAGNASSAGGSNSTEVQYAPINSNGSLGTWTLTTALTQGRFANTAFAYNGKLYNVGGFHSTAASTGCSSAVVQYCSDVLMATINTSTGAIGAWSAQAELNFRRSGASVVLNGANVYILGGDGGGCAYVETGTIASDGTISSWTASIQSGNYICRTAAMAGYNNGYIYFWGNNTSDTNAVSGLYARTADDGSLASNAGCGTKWCAMASLTNIRFNRGGGLSNGVLYSLGGSDASAATTTVETAAIDNGGNTTLGSFTTSGSSFTTARTGHASVAYMGYLYVIGGVDSASTRYDDVQYAPLNKDGTVGSWTTDTSSSLPTGVSSLSAVAFNGVMYVLGGYDGTNRYNTVRYAAIATDGSLGAWTSTNSFITARSTMGVSVYNGYMYLMGGTGSGCTAGVCGDVQYAVINGNGTLGSWHYTHDSTDDSTTFVAGFSGSRYAFTSLAYDGYLYIFGGQGATALNDVQYAPINSDGTIGTWSATTNLPAIRSYGAVTAANGFVYLTGGYDGTNPYSTTWSTWINNNGSLGTWATTSSISSTRYGQQAVIANGYLYVTGGYHLGSWLNDVQYARLNSMARIGHYSQLVDLGTEGNIKTMTYTGNATDVFNNISYKVAKDDGVFGSSIPFWRRTTNSTDPCSGTSVATRYILVSITLEDSYGWANGSVFADANNTPSNVGSFTFTYNASHPDTATRLRGGKTLQSGTLSALDTCL